MAPLEQCLKPSRQTNITRSIAGQVLVVVLSLCCCVSASYEPGGSAISDGGHARQRRHPREPPARFINRFGELREPVTPDPNMLSAVRPGTVFRNGGRRQCPVPSTGSNNVGYDKFDPNRCVDTDVGIEAGWRPDLQGALRPGADLTDAKVELDTKLGPLTGFRVALYDKPGLLEEQWPARLRLNLHKERLNVTVFLGIPYAQPPTEEGRFKPPRPQPSWQRWRALDFGPACPQPAKYVTPGLGVREVDEDCLYLNVFTPQVSSNVKDKYAVLVYIHGGHFSHGASNLFPGHLMAAWGEVIVVTFNYRLGALGFLSTGDEHSPGNYGLLDQAMALEWVYDNVHYFNGDRERITVFGEDAGAVSAGLLAVDPRTKHMVSQLIAQSGSPLADWGSISDVERARNTSRVFAGRIGCLADTSTKLVNCLSKGRSALEIGDVDFKPEVGVFPWAPVVQTNISLPPTEWYDGWKEEDWKVLPDTPERLLRERQLRTGLRILTGVNRDEAADYVYSNTSLAPDFSITQRWMDTKVKEWVLQNNFTLNPRGTEQAILKLYTYWPDPRNQTWIRQMFINFVTDALYTAPMDALVKVALSVDIPTYQYVLNTSIEALRLPRWRETPHGLPYFLWTGAPFMDPVFYPGDVRIERDAWTERDRNMSQLMVEAFSNFAKYGRPSPRKILNTVSWLRALPGDQRFLAINNTFNSTMHSNFRQTETAFWTFYIPMLTSRELTTYRPTTPFWWEERGPLQIAFWTVTGLAFLLLLICVLFCCLWHLARRKGKTLYEDSFEERALDIQENSHFVESISKPPSMAASTAASLASVQEHDVSTVTHQTTI